MPCFTPLKAYRGPDGIAFNSVEGYVDRPLELPCGKCIGCREYRAQQWALRLVHEQQMHKRSCVITLTYDQEHVPQDGSVDVRHWQLFAKRLRKELGPFRFLHCGEYGDQNRRPHYHAVLFGHDFAFDRQEHVGRGEHPQWDSPTLRAIWGQGKTHILDLTYESAAYVARYCFKKYGGDRAAEEYTRYDSNTGECWSVRPPYITMSRRPGIGATWFEKYQGDVFPMDEVVLRGRKFRPPRFYDERLPEPTLEDIKRRRRNAAFQHKEELTDARLKIREKVAAARLGRLRREL